MRKFSAFAVALALVGATFLYAASSWNGFSITATPTGGGGYGTVYFPALSCADSVRLVVEVHYQGGGYDTYTDMVAGTRSAGQFDTGGGTGGQEVTEYVYATATCYYPTGPGYISALTFK